MAIFARNFAGSDLPPPAAISGDQGETLPNFRQKVPVFSEWARHRGDVRNPKGFVSKYGKIRGGSFQLRTELKILRAQPFFRTNNSPTLDQGIQGQRGGVSIIEITSVEEIMIALILFQKEARVWFEYCGPIQREDPNGLSNLTYGDGEYLGVSSLVSTSE
ncbi:hypothetical protein L3X38_035116 [Prunus dulcis]|uniref:Uncharacterized protein n=1 Tax=Prunus dulcis TaxID=3755 RepID=A0AAD4VLK3_PRUDU|nr:hypothetical protein L3X38_035116 [Prunus dulcis]